MVEKMKLLHITGPKYDIDRVVKLYLGKYDIHFENAMTSLNNLKNVRPFVETNLYKETAQKGEELKEYLEPSRRTDLEVTQEQAQEIILGAYGQLEEVRKEEEGQAGARGAQLQRKGRDGVRAEAVAAPPYWPGHGGKSGQKL